VVTAVVYARFSSELQADRSIDDQVRLCRRLIQQQGWEYQHAYTDRAVSGATALRPAYQALLEDARRGGYDVVVAEALDRLSRDQEDVAGLLKRLRFAGVRLFTVAEGEISELHVGLKGTMNALFLKDLAQKVRRGLEGRVREGRSGGGVCFGYDIVREYDRAGAPIPGGRSINDVEAAIVRRVFGEFAGGSSPRAIAQRLNRERISGPRGEPGVHRRSMAIGGAEPAPSTTSSTSASSSGTDRPLSKTPTRASVRLAPTRPRIGSSRKFWNCGSLATISGTRSRRGSGTFASL